jgi:hypothetical protein
MSIRQPRQAGGKIMDVIRLTKLETSPAAVDSRRLYNYGIIGSNQGFYWLVTFRFIGVPWNLLVI